LGIIVHGVAHPLGFFGASVCRSALDLHIRHGLLELLDATVRHARACEVEASELLQPLEVDQASVSDSLVVVKYQRLEIVQCSQSLNRSIVGVGTVKPELLQARQASEALPTLLGDLGANQIE